VFKLTPSGVLTTLYILGLRTEGCFAIFDTALLQASDGNFYGTTPYGGGFGGGTTFKLTPSGVLTTLHAFDCSLEGCNPFAALLQASDRRLYGTFSGGAPKGGGGVFQLNPPVQSASY
jgi:uncharacterized repeat protein (TIGR03803 family)